MKKLFRLKKDARQFFDKKFLTSIMPLKSWQANNVHENALEEVDKIYISYGHTDVENFCTQLKGWSGFAPKNSAKFFFTINVLDVESKEYEFIKDSHISELMDRLQNVINDYIAEKELF